MNIIIRMLLLGILFMNLGSLFSSDLASVKTAYDFSFRNLKDDSLLPLNQFKGKVILIVNTASKCGFTSQYQGLENLYQKYQEKGLVVIGVPCNDFGSQEPGTQQEIASFCQINYGVSFPMTSKEHVCGSHAHPFYIWAKQELGFGTAPKWNFHKYLINRQGKLVDYFHSTTSPESSRFLKVIEKELSYEDMP